MKNEIFVRALGLVLYVYHDNGNRTDDMRLNDDKLSRDEWIFMLLCFAILFSALYLDL